MTDANSRQPGCGPCCHDHAPAAVHRHEHEHGHDHHHERPRHAEPALGATAAATGELRWSSLRIEAMDCPTEERMIRNVLEPMKEIEKLDFNLISRLLTVTHTLPDEKPIVAAIRTAGMEAVSRSILIFYVPMLVVLALVTYVPELSLWLPRLFH